MASITKFALAPGLTSNLPNEYSTTWGLKHWSEAAKMLSEEYFDGSPQNLKMFFERLAAREWPHQVRNQSQK